MHHEWWSVDSSTHSTRTEMRFSSSRLRSAIPPSRATRRTRRHRERATGRERAAHLYLQPSRPRGSLASPRERAVYPIAQGRARKRERPRDLRRIAAPIAASRQCSGRDDRRAQSPAQRQRIDGIQVVGIFFVMASEGLRDQDLLDKKRGQRSGDETSAATPVISGERDRHEDDRSDSDARDTSPPRTHIANDGASIVPDRGGPFVVASPRDRRLGGDARPRRALLLASARVESLQG